MNELVVAILNAAIERAHAAGKLKSGVSAFGVEAPRDPAHGDVASNAAMVMARSEGESPRAIAEIIRQYVELPPEIEEVTVAGPGFINFRMSPAFWQREIRRAGELGAAFWLPRFAAGKKIQVEFLSANPTGPLTVGHGRNAVLGDTIARLFEAGGATVTREYYFNDGGRQMRLLGESVRARYLQALGRDAALPEDGYQGEYIGDIGRTLMEGHGAELARTDDIEVFRAAAVEAIFADIRRTCVELKIRFDLYSNELDLIRSGKVAAVLAGLASRGLTYEKDGAVWLRAEPLGLPKDRALVRSGDANEPIYRTPDIAYHIEKLKRDSDLIVDVFGADHIAEHQDVLAALKALGHDTSRIHAIIYQFVTLTQAGEKVKMSTRRATYVTLDELIAEVGPDVARFFFLFRKSSSHLDFDLELARRQAPENPVFYVQYAYARLASVFREASARGLELPSDRTSVDLTLLSAEELELAKRALELPDVVSGAAEELEPHRIPFFLFELAGQFHRYYNQPTNRIIGPERELSLARLVLAGLIKECMARGLEVLGVNAPERM